MLYCVWLTVWLSFLNQPERRVKDMANNGHEAGTDETSEENREDEEYADEFAELDAYIRELEGSNEFLANELSRVNAELDGYKQGVRDSNGDERSGEGSHTEETPEPERIPDSEHFLLRGWKH